MFEGLLYSALDGILSKNLKDFSAKNLKMSVWKGNIELNNSLLRTDIFQQFKLPLELIMGRVGTLQITVPWSSLGSSPVDVVVEDVLIIVSKFVKSNFFIRANYGPV